MFIYSELNLSIVHTLTANVLYKSHNKILTRTFIGTCFTR